MKNITVIDFGTTGNGMPKSSIRVAQPYTIY